MKCGLLGRKLGHSYSAQIHSYLGDYEYNYHELEPDELNAFFSQNDLSCFNITIPYKKDVIPLYEKKTDSLWVTTQIILDSYLCSNTAACLFAAKKFLYLALEVLL